MNEGANCASHAGGIRAQGRKKPFWLLSNTRRASAGFRKLVTIRKAEYIVAIRWLPKKLRSEKSCDKSSQKVKEMIVESDTTIGSNWKLTLAYDGTDFYGWQVQPDRVTIQGTLAESVERVTAEHVLPQGSGRTDAGVHARGQVASFWLQAPIPAENLHRALNRKLPESIRVLKAERAAPEFHARHSARAKTYEYRIWRGETCLPWEARFAWALNWPLDVERMQEAARSITGNHDFTSFAAMDPDLATRRAAENSDDADHKGNVRTVFESNWKREGELLIYRVRGNGFLHHMVRNLVGTLVDVGRGAIEPAEIRQILDSCSRSAAGPTAPARGLWLDSVEY
jgi:tRNA pseudouridine38-40 synthase